MAHKLTNNEALKLIEKAKKLLDGDHNIAAEPVPDHLLSNKECIIPNCHEEFAMLEWAGVCFGQDYAFMLQKSLKRLAVLSGASRVRFFGRIFGRKQDYLIA